MIVDDPIFDHLAISLNREIAEIKYHVHAPILSSKATPEDHPAHDIALYIWHPITRKETATFNLYTGKFAGEFAFDLGTFETVNGDQWAGRPPFELKSRPHKNLPMTTLDTAPPLWEVATINVRTGERIVVLKTHGQKDEAFKIGNRFNIIADYGRTLLAPWENELRAGQRIPPEELAQSLTQMPPDFAFGKKPIPANITRPKGEKPRPFSTDITSQNSQRVKETDDAQSTNKGLIAFLVIFGIIVLLGVVSSG